MSHWYELKNSHEIPSPALIVYPDRIIRNLQQMIHLVGDVQKLRPHVKTHKMAEVVRLKRELGIDKFKTSTIAEAEMTAAAGGRDILLSYQPTGPNVDRLLQLIRRFPETRFSTIVDDPGCVDALGLAATEAGIEIPLYVDLDVGMGRTGITPGDAALALCERIVARGGVRLAGLHAYDGHLHTKDAQLLEQQAAAAFEKVITLRDRLHEKGIEIERIIASGTPTFPLTAKHSDVEVGCGTTVLWDYGQPQHNPEMGFVNAAVLLCRVISKPGENRLTIDLGHKAVASEMPHPRVMFFGLEEARPVIHSEEHFTLETPLAGSYQVGDVVYGIPTHICPTVALHEQAWVAREGQAQEQWAVIARRRKITI